MTEKALEKKDLKIRAIYIGDVKFNTCPVFELNTETNKFVMLEDSNFQYDDLVVYDDKDFLIFEVYKVNQVDLFADEDDEDYVEEFIEIVKQI